MYLNYSFHPKKKKGAIPNQFLINSKKKSEYLNFFKIMGVGGLIGPKFFGYAKFVNPMNLLGIFKNKIKIVLNKKLIFATELVYSQNSLWLYHWKMYIDPVTDYI